MLVRFKPGIVGETQRAVHIVPLGENPRPDDAVLTALCGTTLPPSQVEQVPALSGMPCTLCLLNTPAPEHDNDDRGLPAGSSQRHAREVTPPAVSGDRLPRRTPGACLHPMLRPAEDTTVPLWLGWLHAATITETDTRTDQRPERGRCRWIAADRRAARPP